MKKYVFKIGFVQVRVPIVDYEFNVNELYFI
jgi:hypothetical protein